MDKQLPIMDRFLSLIGQKLTSREIIDSILKELCLFYNGDRAVIISINREDNTFGCSSEWCNKNKKPIIYSVQSIPTTSAHDYSDLFVSKHKPIRCDDLKALKVKSSAKKALNEFAVESFIACPLTQTGVITGYVQIDNPKKKLRNLEFLRIGCIFITFVAIREELSNKRTYLDSTNNASTLFSTALQYSYPLNVIVNLSKDTYLIQNNTTGFLPGDISQSGAYSNFLQENARTMKEKKDQDRYLGELNINKLIEKSKNGKNTNTIRYRQSVDGENYYWFETSVLVIPGEEYKAIYLTKNVDIEVRANIARQEASKHNDEIIHGITTEYTVLYRVDFTTNKIELFSVTDKMAQSQKFIEKHSDYMTTNRAFIKFFVHPMHQEMMLKYCDKEFVSNLMAHKKKDSIFFLRKYDNEYLWTEQVIIKFDNENEPLTFAAIGFIEKDKEYRADEQSKLNDKVLLSLAANYVAVFRVNLKKDIAERVIFSDEFRENVRKVAPKMEKTNSFIEKIKMIGNTLVADDERDYFFDRLLQRDLAGELAAGRDVIINFRSYTPHHHIRHFQLRIVAPKDPTDEWVIVGVRDYEEEFNSSKNYSRQLEDLKDKLTAANVLANSFANTFENACYVNLVDGSFIAYNTNTQTLQQLKEFKDYYSAVKVYIDRYAHKEDKEMLLNILEYKHIINVLRAQEQVDYLFRDIHTGEEIYYRISIIRGADNDHCAIGFVNVDKLIKEENEKQEKLRAAEEAMKTLAFTSVLGQLAEDYDFVAYVDNASNKMNVLKLSGIFSTIFSNYDETSERIEARFKQIVQQMVVEEDQPLFEKIIDSESVKRTLTNEGSFSQRFRAFINNKIEYYNIKIVISDDGKGIVVGLVNISSVVEKENERILKERESRTNAFISSLAQDYEEVIYCDLLNKDIFGQIQERPRYSLRFSSVVPEWKTVNSIFDLQKLLVDNFAIEDEAKELRVKLKWDNISKFVLNNQHFVQNMVLKLNDELVNFELRIVPVKDGNIIHGIVFGMRDIESEVQARKAREREIERSLQYHNVLVSSSQGYAEINLTQNVILADTFGSNQYAPEQVKDSIEIAKVNFNDFEQMLVKTGAVFGNDDYLKICNNEYLINAYNEGRHIVELTASSRTADGLLVHMKLTYYLYKDSVTGEINALCLVTDISEQVYSREKQEQERAIYEQQLEEARISAEQASRAKTSFLFNMSHDIRTPMNAITGFTAIAQKHLDDKEKTLDYLKKIENSSKHLLSLINDVLDMSRIESGNVTIQETPINSIEVISGGLEMCKALASAKNIDFTMDLSGIKNNLIYADELHINQLTMNIVSNAIKYTPEGGKVALSVTETDSGVAGYTKYRVVVKDNGIGMSQEFLQTIYEPFSRERTSTISKIEGTGLGMTIVRKLIDLVDGQINVQSELGKGTTVTLEIPFRMQETSTVEKQVVEVETKELKGKRLLVVEDNELNREIVKDILEEQGLIIELAEDGDIAVDILKQHADKQEYNYYDAILMDVQMPRMNGYVATNLIREISAPEGVHIPIIAMTANAFDEDRKRAIEAGMDAHLAKPIDIDKLFQTLSKFIN